jgi:hypothetical protein
MKVERQILHHCLAQAKSKYKSGDKDLARDFADMGIGYVASKRHNGMGAKEKVEGVRIELWLERFWNFLENKGLLL